MLFLLPSNGGAEVATDETRAVRTSCERTVIGNILAEKTRPIGSVARQTLSKNREQDVCVTNFGRENSGQRDKRLPSPRNPHLMERVPNNVPEEMITCEIG